MQNKFTEEKLKSLICGLRKNGNIFAIFVLIFVLNF